MSLFDLKPLSEESIAELGLDPHELWIVKIADHTFGPFETLSLRHYAKDNRSDFDGAFATRTDEEDWKYFEHIHEFNDIFQEVKVPVDEEVSHEKHYWILNQGQVSPPHKYSDIEKKMEMGILSLTDAISSDEGDTWHKIFELEEFAHKLHSGGELPRCPSEASFQDAKVKVLEKIEAKSHEASSDNVPGLVYLGQKTTQIVLLKLDEISIDSLQETEISKSLKWAIPSAAVGVVALVMIGFFSFGGNEEAYLITENDVQVKRSISGSRSGLLDDPMKNRRPSSVKPLRSQRSRLTRRTYQESSYPTHIETHQDPNDDHNRGGHDPQHEAIFDNNDQPQPQTEESLVQNAQAVSGENLDAMMGNQGPQEVPLEQAQVEEISDF